MNFLIYLIKKVFVTKNYVKKIKKRGLEVNKNLF